MLRIIEEGIISHQRGRGAYMPSITVLPDGTFLACQHVGSDLCAPDNHIVLLRSRDGGRRWIDEGCIHDLDDDAWAYRSPDISVIPDGRLAMTATRFRTDTGKLFDPENEGLQRPEMLIFWSSDWGLSWTSPQIVPVALPPEKYTWNGAGRLLQLSSNRWMYPLETWKPKGFAGPPDQKSAAVFSSDEGRTWGEFTVVADDPEGKILWWDQMCETLPDGRVYTLLWAHLYGTSDDLANHWVVSDDEGRTWSEPRPTNLWGQVCTPVALADGRVVAVYNFRQEPQGIRVAMTDDLERYDAGNEVAVFDAGSEAALGRAESDNFLATHMLIAFGKPRGVVLPDGHLLTYFWCTSGGVTHTRWVRMRL
jgi:hypothetical protein